MALVFEKVSVIPEKVLVRQPSADTIQLAEAVRKMQIGEILRLNECSKRTYMVRTAAALLEREGKRLVLQIAVRQGDLYVKRVA